MCRGTLDAGVMGMGLAVPFSHARAAVSSDAHHTTPTTPSRPKKEAWKRKRDCPGWAAGCNVHTRGAQSLGYDRCSDELGEPDFGLELGLVDVNAVFLGSTL